MKNLVKLVFIFALLISFGSFAKEEKKKVESKYKSAIQGISPEALEEMKIEQNLIFLKKTDSYFENAVFNFEQLEQRAVDPLLRHLRNNRDDKQIVTACIYTLGRLGRHSAKAVPTITGYLKNEDYDVRLASIAALGRIGKHSDKAVPELKEFLDDPDEFARTVTLRSLKEIGTPQSTQIAREYEKMQLLIKKRQEAQLEEKNNRSEEDTETSDSNDNSQEKSEDTPQEATK